MTPIIRSLLASTALAAIAQPLAAQTVINTARTTPVDHHHRLVEVFAHGLGHRPAHGVGHADLIDHRVRVEVDDLEAEVRVFVERVLEATPDAPADAGEGDEDDGGSGIVGGGLGTMFAGLIGRGGNDGGSIPMSVPRTLKEAMTVGGAAATVIRYGDLFGAPESSVSWFYFFFASPLHF